MTSKAIRWGILSAAQIARKNWQAIQLSGNAIVAAVASRDVLRAEKFIQECQSQAPMPEVPVALGSYEALLARKDIDAVYIPLPTGPRKEWVLKAAAAGKHVVCEKPCAVSTADLREMVEACRKNRVQFMDGVMFMHSRRLDSLRSVLQDAAGIGGIQRISSAFSFRAPPEFFTDNIRAHSALEPHGCLGDLGWYCIRFALWTMGEQLPQRVTGRLLNRSTAMAGGQPIPTEFSAELLFEGGTSAGFYCSFLTHNEQWSHISGTKGGVRVDDFVLPYFGDEAGYEVQHSEFVVDGCDFHMEGRRHRRSVAEYSNSHRTAQETNLFRDFSAQIGRGVLNEAWPEMALKTQQVMDACYASALSGGREMTLG